MTVRNCLESHNMMLYRDETPASANAYLFWYDSVVLSERVQELKNYQRVNHFPSMGEICRKDYLARNMAK